MYLPYVRGIFAMMTILMSQARQTPLDSGWIPLTAGEVYSNVRTKFNPDALRTSPKYIQNKTDVNMIGASKMTSQPVIEQTDNHNIHSIRSKAIKLVTPETKLNFGQDNVIFNPIEPETIKSVNELRNINDESNEHVCENTRNPGMNGGLSDDDELQEVIIDLKTRKSKAILDDYSNKSAKKLLVNTNSKLSDNANDFRRRFIKDIGRNDKLYKVTEDPIEVLEDEENNTDETSGYFYTPPKLGLDLPVQNNITRTFLDILSRLNIKPEDELPNYTLSRKVKVQDATNAFMFIPVPLRVLPQFNNLKQLSVDPLLAVLMSNYGYYFPGSYGIHSRYRNLYGHLASNNIHNNKPFGSYKIFSDTDSSN